MLGSAPGAGSGVPARGVQCCPLCGGGLYRDRCAFGLGWALLSQALRKQFEDLAAMLTSHTGINHDDVK